MVQFSRSSIHIHAPPTKEFPNSQIYKEEVTIRISIASNGSVDGQVGTAHIVGCKITSNQGWFGKTFNLWSDQVVCDGCLEGPLFRKDPNDAKRSFAIPLDFQGGTLTGRFLLVKQGEKPFNLFFNLELKKQPPAQTPKKMQ